PKVRTALDSESATWSRCVSCACGAATGAGAGGFAGACAAGCRLAEGEGRDGADEGTAVRRGGAAACRLKNGRLDSRGRRGRLGKRGRLGTLGRPLSQTENPPPPPVSRTANTAAQRRRRPLG